jgi:hypothetical protein
MKAASPLISFSGQSNNNASFRHIPLPWKTGNKIPRCIHIFINLGMVSGMSRRDGKKVFEPDLRTASSLPTGKRQISHLTVCGLLLSQANHWQVVDQKEPAFPLQIQVYERHQYAKRKYNGRCLRQLNGSQSATRSY